jgi:uncharacterized protein (DUF1697 family)
MPYFLSRQYEYSYQDIIIFGMVTYVAFLRGINVGGNTMISMARLKECFEKLSYKNVKTYINSGNVVFHSDIKDPAKLEQQIEKAINKSFDLPVRVMVRSFEEMEKLIKRVPDSWDGSKDFRYNVIFLSRTIDSPDILKNLDPKPEIEELHYRPGVLFWSAKTSDLTKTSMLKINKMAIYKEMTVRGINTTRKIYALMVEATSSIS